MTGCARSKSRNSPTRHKAIHVPHHRITAASFRPRVVRSSEFPTFCCVIKAPIDPFLSLRLRPEASTELPLSIRQVLVLSISPSAIRATAIDSIGPLDGLGANHAKPLEASLAARLLAESRLPQLQAPASPICVCSASSIGFGCSIFEAAALCDGSRRGQVSTRNNHRQRRL